MRHHAPHTTCLGYVEDGIHYLSKLVLGWAASNRSSTPMLGYQMLYLLSLCVRQVCGVSLSAFHSPKYTLLLGY
jgi:hypothetical protein